MDKETLDLLQQFAAKLGTTADHIWAILVRQAYVEFWADMVPYAIWVAWLVTVYKYLPRLLRWLDERVKAGKEKDRFYSLDGKEFAAAAAAIIAVVLSIAFTVIAVCNIPSEIVKVLNPEYWALQQILQAVKK